MSSFWAELKKRKVVRATLVYAVVAWLLIQIVDVFAPKLLLPDWVSTLVAFLLILGFPLVLVLAWAYDLTPDGLVLTPSSDPIDDRSVENAADAGADASTASEHADHKSINSGAPSIAVLPFRNVSPDPDNEYFSDGIADELLGVLSRIQGLRVAARTSCFHFKNRDDKIQTIGEELGVSTILEGSVRFADDKVRVTAQLINTVDGYQLWSRTFNHEMENLLQVQDDIAQSILIALRGEILIEEQASSLPTNNEEAYRSFLRGRYLWQRRDRESIDQGINFLRKAIGLDPTFANAYATLAAAYHKLPLYDETADSEVSQHLAEEAARGALALNSELVDAHATLGSILADSHRYAAADEAFDRALALDERNVNAQHWYAVFLLNTGRCRRALRHIEIAQRLDPLNAAISGTHGNIAFALGQLESAIRIFKSASQLGWSDAANAFLGAIYLYRDEPSAAKDCLRAGRFAAEEIPSSVIESLLEFRHSDPESSRQSAKIILEKANSGEISSSMAFRLLALIESTKIFELNFDTSQISGDALGMLWHPTATAIRRDNRFETLVKKFDLPALWEKTDWPDSASVSSNGPVFE